MIERCPWYVAGPLLGLLIVGLRAAINKPFGALGGFIDLAENIGSPRRWGLRTFLLAGLVIGGVVFTILGRVIGRAAQASDVSSWGAAPASALVLLVAGLVMGFGARTAGGCTSGHGMSGMSLGSRASIASSMTFFAVAVALTQLLALLGGVP